MSNHAPLKSDAELDIFHRKLGSKGELNSLRASGNIPGVLYQMNGPSKPVFIEKSKLLKLFSLYKGRVSSLILSLIQEDGSKVEASIKEIQYDIITYDVIHVDFQLLSPGVHINVNIPVLLKGVESCAGVKLGGVLRQVIRKMRVRCLPKDIPPSFEIDVKDLNIKKSIKLSSINIPSGVLAISDTNQVAVVVAKR